MKQVSTDVLYLQISEKLPAKEEVRGTERGTISLAGMTEANVM